MNIGCTNWTLIYKAILALSTQTEIIVDERLCHFIINKFQCFQMMHFINEIVIFNRLMGDGYHGVRSTSKECAIFNFSLNSILNDMSASDIDAPAKKQNWFL